MFGSCQGCRLSPNGVMPHLSGLASVAAMGEINGLAVLVAVGIWVSACAVLLVALSQSRNAALSPLRRGALLALADEFLALSRQTERALSARPSDGGTIPHPDQGAAFQQRTAALLEVLRSQLTDDSRALHHAEAIFSILTSPDTDREPGPRMDFHRSRFAATVWEDVDRAAERRGEAQRAPSRRLRRARSLHEEGQGR
jgi:hypothetical protein